MRPTLRHRSCLEKPAVEDDDFGGMVWHCGRKHDNLSIFDIDKINGNNNTSLLLGFSNANTHIKKITRNNTRK